MSLKRFILDSLKTKFPGIDEKVLSRIAAVAVKTVKNEEEAKNHVDELTLQQVIDSYSDSRATDAQEKAVKSYEEKFGLKDGKKAGSTEEPGGEGDDDGDGNGASAGNGKKGGEGKGGDMPEYVKALFGKLDTLTNEVTTLKDGKVADTRKNTLNALLKDAPEKTKASFTKNFNRMQFKDDADFEDWIDEITPDVEDATTQQAASDGVVGRPKGGAKTGNEGQPNSFVQARVNARKAETVAPAIIGLPTTKSE